MGKLPERADMADVREIMRHTERHVERPRKKREDGGGIRKGEQVCGTCQHGDFGPEGTVYPGYGTCRYYVPEQITPLAVMVTKVRMNIWPERGRAWPCPVWFQKIADAE